MRCPERAGVRPVCCIWSPDRGLSLICNFCCNGNNDPMNNPLHVLSCCSSEAGTKRCGIPDRNEHSYLVRSPNTLPQMKHPFYRRGKSSVKQFCKKTLLRLHLFVVSLPVSGKPGHECFNVSSSPPRFLSLRPCSSCKLTERPSSAQQPVLIPRFTAQPLSSDLLHLARKSRMAILSGLPVNLAVSFLRWRNREQS